MVTARWAAFYPSRALPIELETLGNAPAFLVFFLVRMTRMFSLIREILRA